jgi:hypothetical protein
MDACRERCPVNLLADPAGGAQDQFSNQRAINSALLYAYNKAQRWQGNVASGVSCK